MKKSIILAAGKGTRMGSDLPKVVQKVCGREMINHVLDMTKNVGIEKDIVVLGYKGDMVKEAIDRDVVYTYQEHQLGTADAVKTAINHIDDDDTVVVLFGDVPLIKSKTIEEMMKMHEKSNSALTICTTILDDAGRYGRIVRDKNGNIKGILEAKEVKNDDEKNIKEINVGNMCFNGKVLKECLEVIDNNNVAEEYYIVDAVKICAQKGLKIGAYVMSDFEEGLGANTPEDLAVLEEVCKKRAKK